MTKTQAKKAVQEKLEAAKKLLDEAGLIMDEHQFTVGFLDKLYAPRGHKYSGEEAMDGNDPFGFYFESLDGPEEYEEYIAGNWLSSSEYRGC